jgi:hypothetical protein
MNPNRKHVQFLAVNAAVKHRVWSHDPLRRPWNCVLLLGPKRLEYMTARNDDASRINTKPCSDNCERPLRKSIGKFCDDANCCFFYCLVDITARHGDVIVGHFELGREPSAIDLYQHSFEVTAAKLTQVSTEAQDNGKDYALGQAQRAAEKVALNPRRRFSKKGCDFAFRQSCLSIRLCV